MVILKQSDGTSKMLIQISVAIKNGFNAGSYNYKC